MAPLRVLEFYSGIGGMHYAADLAGLDHRILHAFDVNDVANNVYKHNFGTELVVQNLIEAFPIQYYDNLAADVWTMSPPCQPYTRIGLQKGSKDGRAKSFLHLLDVLGEMKNRPKYILVENVKGFEESDSRDMLIERLQESNYCFQEFLLTPLQLGIPNSRMRYYLLAKLKPLSFAKEPTGTILYYVPLSDRMSSTFVDSRTKKIPSEQELVTGITAIEPLSRYLEPDYDDNIYHVSDKVLLKHGLVFDIVKPSSCRSCCFTKSYFAYAQGTGSILQLESEADTHAVFDQALAAQDCGDNERQLKLLHSLKLRYFTPREVANLMGFPASFQFPDTSSLKQRYRTLGNSINVRLVSELMLYMFK